jgi:hypothetical protein
MWTICIQISKRDKTFIESMLPNPRGTARYAQLYFIDIAEATKNWMQRNPECM